MLEALRTLVSSTIPSYFDKTGDWATDSKLVYPLILSLLSALIFWLIFSYFPNKKRKDQLRPIVEVDMYQIYQKLFTHFDLVMSHQDWQPSEYQLKN